MVYLEEEVENQILNKFHIKGWNLYKSTYSARFGADEIIRKYLAEKLEVSERYVMLPKTEDPREPNQVMNALDRLAVKLNRQMPTIKINGERFPWTGFIPRKNNVKVNTIIGHYISYSEFIEALDSIVSVY